jgi:hypothetical protein
MRKYPTWFGALVAVTCWLVVLASADDFNLARAVLPLPAPAPDGPLPLDDPNTDFTEHSEPRSPTTTHQDRPRPTGPRSAGTGLRTPVAPSARSHPLRTGINAPLRC